MTPSLRPIGRFEWEQVVRRLIMPGPHKYLCLMLGTFADADGTRVRPGNDLLAAMTGQTKRNVIRQLNVLRDAGLIRQLSRGGGRGNKGKAAEYRLTMPLDLLDRFELIPVNGREPIEVTPQRPTGSANGSHPTETGDTEMSPQTPLSAHEKPPTTVDSPVENPHPQAETAQNEVTSNSVTKPIEVTSAPIEVTSRCRPTTHIHQPPLPTTVVATQRKSRPRARPREPPPHPSTPTSVHRPLRRSA